MDGSWSAIRPTATRKTRLCDLEWRNNAERPLTGKQPRVANMLVEDYLRPAAVKAGVLKEGEKVRFGFHNLRHSLASFLVRKGTDEEIAGPTM
jgi:integrase